MTTTEQAKNPRFGKPRRHIAPINLGLISSLREQGYSYKEIGQTQDRCASHIQKILAPNSELRAIIIAQHNYQCGECGAYLGTNGHIHHLNPKIGNEITNLAYLCTSCHSKWHKANDLSPIEKAIERGTEITVNGGLTPIQAADKLGCPETTIHYWLKHGKLDSISLMGIQYIPKSQIERIKHGKQES